MSSRLAAIVALLCVTSVVFGRRVVSFRLSSALLRSVVPKNSSDKNVSVCPGAPATLSSLVRDAHPANKVVQSPILGSKIRDNGRDRAAQLLQVVDDRLSTWRPLELFYGSTLASEDQKWRRHRELSEQLEKDPGNVELLGERAVIRLQCGIPFHAYSDCERARIRLERAKKNEIPHSLELRLNISLLTLLSFLAMRLTYHQITNELKNLFSIYRSLGADEAFIAKVVSIIESRVWMTEARLQLVSRFDESVTLDVEGRGKILMLVHALWQSIDDDVREKEKIIASSPGGGNLSPKEKAQWIHELTVSNPLVPMQYRSGPGGGRNPHFAQHTLSTLRKEALHNVEIVSDPERGEFKMVAKRDISAGETFLSEEPIVSISSEIVATKECALCMKPLLSRAGRASVTSSSPERLTCKGCGERYCSNECQEKAWQQYHSLLCGSGWNEFLEAMMLSDATSSVPFVASKSIKLILMGVSRGLPPLQWPELQVLHRFTDSLTPINPTNVSTIPFSHMVDKLVGVYQLFQKKCPNLAHHVCLEELLEIVGLNLRNGMGNVPRYSTLYCVGSFANHDCSPNTAYDGHPPKLTFRAMRDIARGEEITISYVDIDEEKNLRSAKLQLFYGFNCTCLRCRLEEG